MRTAFKSRLETNEFPHKIVQQGVFSLEREYVHEGSGYAGSSWRILAAEPVRDGIRDGEAGGKCASGDLIVIIGVTPPTNTALGVGVPPRAVLEVRCVWSKTG